MMNPNTGNNKAVATVKRHEYLCNAKKQRAVSIPESWDLNEQQRQFIESMSEDNNKK